jgi:hypothetical protein
MNRTFTALAALAGALVIAAPASSHASGPVLIIRHQMHGCHAWSLGVSGAAKVSQTVRLKRGVHLGIGNNDVMPHKLVQLAGPRVNLPDGASMNSIGAMIEVRFPKAGVYRFTTKAGEDYSKGIHTIGADNTLELKVIVR